MRLAFVLALILLCATAARGQQHVMGAAGISPPLSVDHWAVGAVRRAEALGLAGEAVVEQPGLSRRQAERIFRAAATNAGPWTGIASAWHHRLLDEFPELREIGTPRTGVEALVGSGAVTAGFRSREGALAPGTNRGNVLRAPLPLASETGPAARLSVAGPSAGPATYFAEARIGPAGVELPTWEVVAGSDALAASVGQGAIRYGYGAGGGVVFGGASIGRVQLYTPRPIALSGPLRYLGPLSFHAFVGRLWEERHAGDPYLAGGRVSVRPHGRVEFGLSRGAMFGGDSASFGLSPVYLFRTLVGFNHDENQILSGDLRFRVPGEAVFPLTGYIEWGMDDISGAHWETPGYVMGLYSPGLPFLPAISLGIERAFFHRQCCGHGYWYRHNRFQGNWATDAAPLGHPLGGHGSEVASYGTIDLYRTGLRLDARATVRDRGAENMYSPNRAGQSIELLLDAAWRVGGRAELRARATREAGDGWDAHTADGGLSVFF